MFLTMGRNGYGVFLFFASMQIASAVFVWFLVPETKACPLERMDRLFAIRPASRANGIVMDEVRIEEAEFRIDAEGAGVGVAKEKFVLREFAEERG